MPKFHFHDTLSPKFTECFISVIKLVLAGVGLHLLSPLEFSWPYPLAHGFLLSGCWEVQLPSGSGSTKALVTPVGRWLVITEPWPHNRGNGHVNHTGPILALPWGLFFTLRRKEGKKPWEESVCCLLACSDSGAEIWNFLASQVLATKCPLPFGGTPACYSKSPI